MSPQSVNLFTRLRCFLAPFQLLALITAAGLLPAVKSQLSQRSIKLLSPKHWWTLIFEHGFPTVLAMSDKMWGKEKTSVMRHAEGFVLEIGPGAGHSAKYYNVDKVDRIIGVEPLQALHPLLRSAVEEAKLTSKYTILPTSIDDDKTLLSAGVKPGSLDTVVCVQVLCSVPNPRTLIERIYSLLKPGGQLLLFEHVQSRDHTTQQLQELWTHKLGWNALTGCNFDRPSARWIQETGTWSQIDIRPGPDETPADIIPHAIGRLIKA